MTDVSTILTKAGVELTEEQKNNVNKEVLQNYKTINEFKKLQDKNDSLKKDLDVANDTIANTQKELENSSDETGTLKNSLLELEKYKETTEEKENNRLLNEQQNELKNQVEKTLSSVIGENEFINEFTQKGIVEQIIQAHAKDNTKGLETYAKELTNNVDGLFKPSNTLNMGKIGSTDNMINDSDIRAVMGLPIKEA